MKDRLKEIRHRQWEIQETIKALKNESKKLREEEMQINGYHKIERSRQKYVRTMGKKKNR